MQAQQQQIHNKHDKRRIHDKHDKQGIAQQSTDERSEYTTNGNHEVINLS
jgi:hypothetical protein